MLVKTVFSFFFFFKYNKNSNIVMKIFMKILFANDFFLEYHAGSLAFKM